MLLKIKVPKWGFRSDAVEEPFWVEWTELFCNGKVPWNHKCQSRAFIFKSVGLCAVATFSSKLSLAFFPALSDCSFAGPARKQHFQLVLIKPGWDPLQPPTHPFLAVLLGVAIIGWLRECFWNRARCGERWKVDPVDWVCNAKGVLLKHVAMSFSGYK